MRFSVRRFDSDEKEENTKPEGIFLKELFPQSLIVMSELLQAIFAQKKDSFLIAGGSENSKKMLFLILLFSEF